MIPNGMSSVGGQGMVSSVVTSTQMTMQMQPRPMPPQQQQQQQVVSIASNPNINLVNALTTGGNKMQPPTMTNGPMMSVGMSVSSGDMGGTVNTVNNGCIVSGGMPQRPLGGIAMGGGGMPPQQQPMMQQGQQKIMMNRAPAGMMLTQFQRAPGTAGPMQPRMRMQGPPQGVMVSSGGHQFVSGNPTINTSAAGGIVQQRMPMAQMQQPQGPVNLPPRYPTNKMENIVQVSQQNQVLQQQAQQSLGPNQQQQPPQQQTQQQQPQQQQAQLQSNQPNGRQTSPTTLYFAVG